MLRTLKAAFACIALAAATMTLAGTAAHAQQPQRVFERVKPPFPTLNIGGIFNGQQAVDRLGANLGTVAQWYGKSADRLRTELLNDLTLRIDPRGRLFVVDEIQRPLSITTPLVQQSVIDGQLQSLSDTFALHSKPGASRTLYLDFNGAVITGTAWNSSRSTITALPFSIDSTVSTNFSTAELQRIQYIWQRVAEDYAAFDVDVTTEPPPQSALTYSGPGDTAFGTTVVITQRSGVYSCSCGGVAYVGALSDSDYYKPALVFYDALGPADEKYVAEAISHEAGHNMGLSHDGSSTTSYYQGQGTDAVTGWAPIMGVGYYKPLTQFSKGEYKGANNKEDDYQVMQGNGLPLRTDDYGNTAGAAFMLPVTLSGSTLSGTIDGVVETAADRDVFMMSVGTGNFTASVNAAQRSPNADLVLSLINDAGTVLATANPLNNLNASLSYNITQAGTYYLEVRGTGQDDPAATGYSSYGSVGLYKLTTSYGTPGGTPPSASFTASPTSGLIAPAIVTFDASASSDTTKFYYWDFGDGTASDIGTQKIISKTYTKGGTFTVRLRVTDDRGFSSTATQAITVEAAPAPVVVRTLRITNIAMSLNVSRSTGSATARASVSVVDQDGFPASAASVAGTWTLSGVVTRTSTATTNTSGVASFSSPATTKRGCFRLTVTNITLAGYTYTPGAITYGEVCR